LCALCRVAFYALQINCQLRLKCINQLVHFLRLRVYIRLQKCALIKSASFQVHW
jgi:hypothetical protein